MSGKWFSEPFRGAPVEAVQGAGLSSSSCPRSLKVEYDKLANEKTEMQRHYVMVRGAGGERRLGARAPGTPRASGKERGNSAIHEGSPPHQLPQALATGGAGAGERRGRKRIPDFLPGPLCWL